MRGWSSRRAGRSCMPVPDPLAPFIGPLERLGVPYCITGSVAASVVDAQWRACLREG